MISYKYLFNPKIKKTNSFIKKKLAYTDISDGYIIPSNNQDFGGVLDAKGKYIKQSSLYNSFSSGYQIELNNCEYRDEKVIYIGLLMNIWGHWLTDNIKRIWFLKTDYYKKTFKKYKLVYVKMYDFTISNNIKQLFDLLEIDITKFEAIDKPTKFKQIIIPDECFYTLDGGNRFYTNEYIKTIDLIKNNFLKQKKKNYISENKYSKIYFSYLKSGSFKLVGEKKLENFFKEQGYQIIYPEKYSFFEQLYMLSECDELASTIGSCSHNFIFAKDNANIILIPRANYFTGYQLALNNIISKKSNIYFVDSSMSIYTDHLNPWIGPFYYYISDNLYDFFKLPHKDNKINDFPIYKLFACLQNRIYKGSKTYEYYEKEFSKLKLNYNSIIKPNKILFVIMRYIISKYNKSL